MTDVSSVKNVTTSRDRSDRTLGYGIVTRIAVRADSVYVDVRSYGSDMSLIGGRDQRSDGVWIGLGLADWESVALRGWVTIIRFGSVSNLAGRDTIAQRIEIVRTVEGR